MSVKHSVVYGLQDWRKLGPPDVAIPTRSKGTSGQVRGTACSGQTFRQTIDSIRNTFAFVEEKVAFRVKKS